MSPLKRALDLMICLTLAIPAVIVILMVLPIVAVETRASPLFRQLRIGRHGQGFRLLKLRTMSADTRQGASHEVGIATITRSGRLLRRTKIDELPQLWNVLCGDMSLVGPRPCLPSQVELIAERRTLGVDELYPGITGVAQVAGIDMSSPLRLARADAVYLTPWRFSRDMAIIIQTAMGHGSGDAAATRR